MQHNLRGLTKPDLLRLIKVPKEKKVIAAILKFNTDLNKQQAKLKLQSETLDQQIDALVYELYGITDDDRKIIEQNEGILIFNR
jgi:hypothetical protein